MATNRNASTASRLSKIPAGGKGRATAKSFKASDLAQQKSAKVGKALSSAGKAVGAFGSKNAGE